MKKIGIIDFGFNNLNSINAVVKHLGFKPYLINGKNSLEEFTSLIVPGVGTYSHGMNFLKKNKLDISINNFAKKGKPILGICLGMQLLFDKSEEFGNHKGLGIIKGSIKILKKNNKNLQVPNIGWHLLKKNELKKKNKLIKFSDKMYAYFIHSYFADPKNKKVISSYIKIGSEKICSSIENRNIFATQFHPEKSGKEGIKILKKFLLN